MNVKTTVILVLIAAALVAYFLLAPEGEAPERDGTPPAGRLLVDDDAIGPRTVERLTVERAGMPTMVFERTGDGDWRQTEPFDFPIKGPDGAGFNIGSIIDAAVSLRYTRKLDDPEAPKTYELDPPRASLRIEGAYVRRNGGVAPAPGAQAEGRVPFNLRFKLGRETAAGRAFVMFGKDRGIYVAGRGLHRQLLDESLTELRERSLAAVAIGRVSRIELRRDDQRLAIEPAEELGTWRFAAGAAGRASADAVEGLVRLVSTARIESFVADQPEDLAPFGLAAPRRELVIHIGGAAAETAPGRAAGDAEEAEAGAGASHRLRIGREVVDGDATYAMYQDRPVVFTLPDYVLDPLGKSLAELRDPRLTPLPRSDLRAARVERPNQPALHVVREAGLWRFGEPRPGFEIEGEAVESLVDAVFDTRAESFVPAEDLPESEARLTLRFAGREAEEVLTLGRSSVSGDTPQAEAPKADTWWVRRGDEPVAAKVRYADLAALFRPLRFYRDRTVLDLRATQIVRLRLKRSGPFAAEHIIARPRQETGTYGEWRYDDNLRPAAVERLIDRLTPLRAQRWVDAPPQDQTPSLVIDITTLAAPSPDAEKTEREPRVSRVSVYRGLKLGMFEGDAFALSTPAVSDLAAELRDRTVIGFEAAEIARLTTPAGHVIERDAAGRYDWSEAADLNEARVGALFDTLAGLQADRYFAPHVEPRGSPVGSYVIESRDGEALTLDLFAAGQTPVDLPAGRIAGRLFTIDIPTARTLMPETQRPPSEPEK